MARMTQALIDRVLDIGGTYYLPYRPHASLAQLSRGYPRAAAFAARKRAVDPDLLFRNQLVGRLLRQALRREEHCGKTAADCARLHGDPAGGGVAELHSRA